jgi:hypothetical protein
MSEVIEQESTLDPVETLAEKTEDAAGEHTQDAEKKFSQAELDEIIQKRIAKEAAKVERRTIKAYAEKLEGMITPRQEAKQSAPSGKPSIANYANVEDYVEAVSDWKLNQRDAARNAETQNSSQKAMFDKTEKMYAEASKIKGFDRESFDELPLSSAVAHAIIDSDIPAKLMAYLASNPDEAERISGLSQTRQAAEIGKIEVKIASTPVKKASSAPDPIDPLGVRSKGTSGDLEKSSMQEYIAARKKQGAVWAR